MEKDRFIIQQKLIKRYLDYPQRANAIIMVNLDNEYSQINFPKSYKSKNVQIEYLGEIEYKI